MFKLYHWKNVISLLLIASCLLTVECEHDDDIYGHSYDDHDYGMSPGTGNEVSVLVIETSNTNWSGWYEWNWKDFKNTNAVI